MSSLRSLKNKNDAKEVKAEHKTKKTEEPIFHVIEKCKAFNPYIS